VRRRSMTSLLTRLRGGWLLPAVLSTTAGAVDVIGFLAVGGLFTAHITGNVVIVAAHYVTGGFSQVGPLLAVPVFMAVLALVTLASGAIARAGSPPAAAIVVASSCTPCRVSWARCRVWSFPRCRQSDGGPRGHVWGRRHGDPECAGKGCPQGRALYRGNDDEHHATDYRPGDARPGAGQTPTNTPRPDAGHA
jgi:hypothetical protein